MSRSRVYFLLFLCLLCFLGRSQHTRQDESCACISNCILADRYIQNGTCRKENIALGKVSTMSERFNDPAWGGQSGPACLANNGNMNRIYLGESEGGRPRCIHTNQSGWWQVDLGRNYTISGIAVYGREKSEYLDRMPTSITVNEQSIYDDTPNEIDLIINLSKTTVGRIVKVSTSRGFLSICQVQVWVDQCSCISDNTTSCFPEGHCRMDNVALGKVAYMSSVYVEQTAQATGQACLAVDGSPGLRDNTITSSDCIMSSPVDDYPWWEVDLGQDYTINKITVYTLESYLENMKGVEISVDEQTCYTFPNTTQPSNITDVKCSQARKGKNVTFTSRENKQLVLCEVQIWVCSWGFYGENCTENCGKCNNATCDVENGTCPTNCELGFTGPLCKECGHGYYGNESTCTLCGHCSGGTACDNKTGNCVDCEYGWHQPQCSVCSWGLYGENCTENCGKCHNNASCDMVNGTCPNGCENGFADPMCKECDWGFYGENCSEVCGKCQNNSTCDVINGNCSTGCEPGFGVPLCNECAHGYYGNKSTCTLCGHCSDGTACDNKTGNCVYCEYGWQAPQCSVCSWGLYGDNCTENCGKCHNNASCDVVNGTCPTGCENGFGGPLCKDSSNNNNGDVAGIVGGIIAAVVVALMIIVIVIFIRRRHRDKAPSTQTDDAALNNKMSSSITTDKSAFISPIGVQGEDNLRNSRPSESLYASIENSSAPLYGNPPSPTTSSNESKHLSIGDSQKPSRDRNNGDFEMSVITPQGTKSRGQIYENVVVPASAERPLVSTKRTDDCQSVDIQQDIDTILGESDVIYNNENIYSTFQPLDATFQMDSLQCSLLASLGCGQLSKQFQDLPKGMIHPHTIGLKQENLKKNRFKALCPYDKNRVKLNRSKGDNDNDYINASYIKGHQRDRAYIAAQGPREHTVDDMWLMIWQENISQIVMLTNIKEEGKDKCTEYWPSKNTTQTYGHVSVTGANEEARANFVIRTFSLKFKGKPIQRQVDQYHYVTWPDHDVPAVPALVSFWRFVHERAVQTVPLLVHCSAGIGRSGTYIALDIAMEMASNGSEVNVHKIVTDLREDRISMVQTESQYRFLHEVILEAYSSRSTGMNLEQFESKVTEPINAHNTNTFIDTEFKMLQQMGEFLPKPSVSVATDQENLEKNRNMNALPDDKYLAYLGVPVEGRNSYINAVFLSSFRHHRGILLTQLPLPETLVDIWRLVDNKDVKTIVSIESKNDHKTIKNYCHYWPKTGRQDMTTGPYRILMSSSTAVTKHLTSYNLSLKTENKTRDVHLLHYTNWTSEIPEDTSCVIHLVQVLNKGHLDKDDSPVLVQCIDGAAKSGLFCVVWNAISRLSCDQEIDIYLTSRDVQTVRRQAVTSEIQYRYCYQVAQDYLHSGVYQNT